MASGIMEIMDLIYGFQKFQVLYSCTSLGVFEELHNSSTGPMTAEAVASKLNLNAGSLGRLMNAAVSIKMLVNHQSAPTQPIKYSNSTTVEKFVVKSSPGSLRALVNNMGDMYMMFGKLSDSVRKGSCPIPMKMMFGMDSEPSCKLIENAGESSMMMNMMNGQTPPASMMKPGAGMMQKFPMYKKLDVVMDQNAINQTKSSDAVVLSAVQTTTQEAGPMIKKTEHNSPKKMMPPMMMNSASKRMEFMQVMHMFSSGDAKQVTQATDLSQFSSACDLGGGTGAFGAHLAETHPHMNVTVFDLPHVVNLAEHFIQDKPDNLHFESGDFFKSPLPTADLYILSHVIHDWSIKDVDLILKRVYNALPKGGALLVLEKCLNENKVAPLQTVFFDVGMLVMSEGQERTAPEYRALLRRHRFSNVIVKFLPKAMYRDAILAKKV